MRKKIFSGLLMVAAVVVATSTFTSCKDTYADDISETQGKVNDLAADVASKYAFLVQEIARLEALQAQCKTSCQTEQARLQELIDALEDRIEALEGIPGFSGYTKAETDALVANLQNQIDALKNEIQALSDELAAHKAEYELLKQTVETLTTDLSTLKNTVQIIDGRLEVVEGKVTDLITTVIPAIQSATATAQATADQALALAQQAAAAAAQVEQAAAAAQAAADAAQAAVQTAQAAADDAKAAAATAQAAAAEAKAAAADNAAAILIIQNDISTINGKIGTLEETTSTLSSDVNTLKQQVAQAITDITGLQTSVNDINSDISDLKAKFNDYVSKEELAEELKNYYTKSEIDDDFNTVNTNLNNMIADFEAFKPTVVKADEFAEYQEAVASRLQQVSDSLSYAYETATAAYTYAVANKEVLEALVANVYIKDTIDAKVDSLGALIDKNKELVDAAGVLADKAYDLADEAKTVAESALNNATVALDKIEALEIAYKAADEALSDRIDDLKAEVDALTARVGNLEFNQEHLITSILIQGTENPVTGFLSTPFGINASVLCAFYGQNTGADITFPNNLLPQEAQNVLGDYETLYLENGETLVDDMEAGEAYLGKVYTTINPNTVDFTGESLALVTSQENKSPATLKPLQKSSEELWFGYTRGGSSNGFYEAEAYISAGEIEDIKPNIDIDAIKDVAKNILNKVKDRSTELNVTNIYKTLTSNMQNVMPAYGLKASWTDADKVEHSIYSQYGLAVTSFKPASFEFLKDYDTPTIPTITPFEYTIDFNLSDPSFTDITSPDFKVTVYVVYDKVFGANCVAAIFDKEADADTYVAAHTGATKAAQTFTIPEFQNFVTSINEDVVAKARTNIKELEDEIIAQTQDNVQKALDKVNSQVVDRVNNIIDKINSRLTNLNHYMQPNLIYEADDYQWYPASSSFLAPVAATQGYIILSPTSYSAEIFAPAFKKFVAITNVFNASNLSKNAQEGDADCKSALNDANEPFDGFVFAAMKTVFSGSKYVTFYGVKGYIYEVTYAAIDYSGKSVANKYYFRVQ